MLADSIFTSELRLNKRSALTWGHQETGLRGLGSGHEAHGLFAAGSWMTLSLWFFPIELWSCPKCISPDYCIKSPRRAATLGCRHCPVAIQARFLLPPSPQAWTP